MASLNKWLGIGRLTKDPELKFIPSGTAVAKIRIACNEKYKNAAGETKESVHFQSVKVWGKTAEAVGEYLKKGSLVMVEGRLRNEEWTGEDGQKRSATLCNAERVLFLDTRGRGEAPPEVENPPAQTPGAQHDGPPPINDDDIPF